MQPRSLGVLYRVGKFFHCPRVLNTCFHVYVLSNLEYCVSVRMSSAEFHLSLLDRFVHSAEVLCDGELCCLGPRKRCLLYKIYHRANHPMHEYLHYYVAARETRASAAPCEVALVIPSCRTD